MAGRDLAGFMKEITLVTLSESELSELLDALDKGGDVYLIRESVRPVPQALIDVEATAVIGVRPYERAQDAYESARRSPFPAVVDEGRRCGAGDPEVAARVVPSEHPATPPDR
jgi:hypothetical protein